ncbi:MAG TPA: hypothetical protein VJT75_08745 [Thermoleophilaceae bacterium]|nr:hypothetical protein [Thermoleophilaceae bacterium]
MKPDPWWLDGQAVPVLLLIALPAFIVLVFEAPVFVLVAGVGIAGVLVFRRRRHRGARDR